MGSQFDSAADSAPFKVLILGGCYGGLSAALNLIDLAEGRAARQGNGVVPGHDGKVPVDITIVDERDGFCMCFFLRNVDLVILGVKSPPSSKLTVLVPIDHLIGSPLALADDAYASKAWVKYDDIPALQNSKVRTVHGTVKSVDPANKSATVLEAATQSTQDLSYDYLVCSTGLRRVWPVVPQSLWRKQYLLEAGAHIDAVQHADAGVVVVGGGAVGIEMAAELKVVQPNTKVTLVHSRDRLLSSEPLPDECKDRALELVREAKVEVLLGKRLAETKEIKDEKTGKTVTEIFFTDGEKMIASVVILAVSKSTPATEFLPKEALEEEGLIKVRSNLMFPTEVANSDSHFAIGDAIKWSGIKRCGGAMHMGFFVAHNIHELLLQKMNGSEPKFQELAEVPPMIGLAVGKKAVSYGPAQGVMSGEDVMKAFFGNDLGFDSKFTMKSVDLTEHITNKSYSLLELHEAGSTDWTTKG